MQDNIQNEITEETRIQEMKEVIHKKIDSMTAVGIVSDLYASVVIHKKIDSMTAVGIVSDLYASVVGCKDCPFMWTCHKRVSCSKSITNYIRKGEIL